MQSIKPIKIGNKTVGYGNPCYIIAEIGSNFDGNLKQAKKLIELAKNSGADAVKFQSFKTDELISKGGFKKKMAFQAKWKKSVWQVYRDAELPREWHRELNKHARKIGIHFFSSPWDFEAVDILDELNVPAFKIGSGDITYHEMLRYVGSKEKPILLATGASTMKEVNEAIKVIKKTGNNKIILLHSVVQYPSPIKEANLKVLNTLQKKFRYNVGYSDHSLGSLIALVSVALGACVIEKHFTINPTFTGPDHPHSMDPKSFKEMVSNIRLLEAALGNGVKRVEPSENETRIIQRRGVWTIKPIRKGDLFSVTNIKALRPVCGISASRYGTILGKKANRNYKSFEPVQISDLR